MLKNAMIGLIPIAFISFKKYQVICVQHLLCVLLYYGKRQVTWINRKQLKRVCNLRIGKAEIIYRLFYVHIKLFFCFLSPASIIMTTIYLSSLLDCWAAE